MAAMTRFDDWTLTLKNLVFPIFCVWCRCRLYTDDNGYFCPECWAQRPRIERPYCSRCGKPHDAMVGLGSPANFPCASCRERPNRYVDRIFAPCRYDGVIKEAVKRMKFHGKHRLAGPLGETMAAFAEKEADCAAYTRIVPVPLHRVRARHRGYNQSLLLAEAASAAFPNAEVDHSLVRIRPTRVQSKLQGNARKQNVRGAFAVQGDTCRDQHVLLVDDVVTSGGTVSECARVLRRAGASRVDVLAAALAAPSVTGF